MYWNEIKKISSAAGFITGIITLAINLIMGRQLLYSAYAAIIVMLVSAIIFLFTFNAIGRILTTFMEQKKREADEFKKAQAAEELKKIQEENERIKEEKLKEVHAARKATQQDQRVAVNE